MSADWIIDVQQLEKAYRSGFRLGPFSLQVPPGQIVGLIGENGAGKTTLLRLLLGVLRKDRGRIRIFGAAGAAAGVEVREAIGYVDEEPILYDWMRVSWMRRFLAAFYRNWNEADCRFHLDRFRIPEKRRIRELSRGNKVKLSIALALSHQPRLIIMDEPTSGLDPSVRQEVLSALQEYVTSNPGVSVLFSSHITSDLEKICDRVLMIDQGQLILDSSIRELQQSAGIRFGPGDSRPVTLEDLFLSKVGLKWPRRSGGGSP